MIHMERTVLLEEYAKLGEAKVYSLVREHLSKVLKDRVKVRAEIIKPRSVSQQEFDPENDYFAWGFKDINREKAEQVGIKYLGRVVDLVPSEMLEGKIQEAARLYRPDFNVEEHYIIESQPIIPSEEYLNHDRGMFDSFFLSDTSRFFQLMGCSETAYIDPWDPRTCYDNIYAETIHKLESGILESPDSVRRRPFTFLKSYDLDEHNLDALGGYNMINVRFQIDVKKLLESRTIFADPEQTIGLEDEISEADKLKSEYKRTFMIPGGIPVNAIHRWELWINHDNHPPPLNREVLK